MKCNSLLNIFIKIKFECLYAFERPLLTSPPARCLKIHFQNAINKRNKGSDKIQHIKEYFFYRNIYSDIKAL